MSRKLILSILFIFLLALTVQALPGTRMSDEAREAMFWKMATMRLGLTAEQVTALKTELDSPLFRELKTTLRSGRHEKDQKTDLDNRLQRMTTHMTEVIEKISVNESAIIDSLLKAYAVLDPTQRRIIAAQMENGPLGHQKFNHGKTSKDTNEDGVIDDAERNVQDKPDRKLKVRHGQGRRGGQYMGRGFRHHGAGAFQAFRLPEEMRKSLAGHIATGTLDGAVLKEAFASWQEQATTALKTLPEKMAERKSAMTPEQKQKMQERREKRQQKCQGKCPQACSAETK